MAWSRCVETQKEKTKTKKRPHVAGMNPNSWGRLRPIDSAPSLVLADVFKKIAVDLLQIR
jgi:hypothetical protein